MLFLSEQEMWQSVTLEDVMDAIEDAYAIHKSGNYKMPDRFIAQRDKNMMLYMPCFLDSVIGTKMLSGQSLSGNSVSERTYDFK